MNCVIIIYVKINIHFFLSLSIFGFNNWIICWCTSSRHRSSYVIRIEYIVNFYIIVFIEAERNKDETPIAIYDVINLESAKRYECQSSDRNLYHRISALTGLDYLYFDIDYDSENRYLIVSYHCDKMFFTKQNDDLILVKSECYKSKDILGKCGKDMINLYKI